MLVTFTTAISTTSLHGNIACCTVAFASGRNISILIGKQIDSQLTLADYRVPIQVWVKHMRVWIVFNWLTSEADATNEAIRSIAANETVDANEADEVFLANDANKADKVLASNKAKADKANKANEASEADRAVAFSITK
jgi:hypothetical protein